MKKTRSIYDFTKRPKLNSLLIWGVIRKFAENICHFYIFWSIELELQNIIPQHICSCLVTACLMLVVYMYYSCRQGNAIKSKLAHFTLQFDLFTAQPNKLQRFVKYCYDVIAHIACYAYLMTDLLLFYANFQRFISNRWCSISKLITVLWKGKAFHFCEPISCFGMPIP